MEAKGRCVLPWYFPRPFLPGPRAKMERASQGAPSAAGVYLWGRNDILKQAFGRLGFKNTKGLLQEAHKHMSYTMWKRCHKIIGEGRSLAKGDVYFGGWLPTDMTICVKSN